MIWTCLTGFAAVHVIISHNSFLAPAFSVSCCLFVADEAASVFTQGTEWRSVGQRYTSCSQHFAVDRGGGCCGKLTPPPPPSFHHLIQTSAPHFLSLLLLISHLSLLLCLSLFWCFFFSAGCISVSLSPCPGSLVHPFSCFAAVRAADQGVSGLLGVITDIWAELGERDARTHARTHAKLSYNNVCDMWSNAFLFNE